MKHSRFFIVVVEVGINEKAQRRSKRSPTRNDGILRGDVPTLTIA